MRLARRALSALTGAALMTTGLVVAGAPAQAAACTGTNGVTVVIQSSAGGTSTRCASGDPSSALGALQSVASVTQVATQPGFICQINTLPESTCQRTPSGSLYWAFFHGPAGGSWTYATVGAGGYDPRPGSSVGFRLGSGSAPSTPPAASAPAPKPTTAKPKPTTAAPRPTTAAPRATTAAPRGTAGTTAQTPAPAGSAARRAATAASSAASAAASPGAGASASTSAPSASPSVSSSATPSTSATTDDTVSAQEPPSTGSGSSGRLVGGGVLLLALATAVGAVALRRRQAAAAASAASATHTDTATP